MIEVDEERLAEIRSLGLEPDFQFTRHELINGAKPDVACANIRKKAAKTSPTQRSLKELRKRGYLCAIVEKWNMHARIRQDLYGIIDVLAIEGEDIVGIQATTGDNVAARITKITEHENYPVVIKAMRIVVHGWRKNAAGKWMLREVEL